MERAALQVREGEIVAFENVAKYVTPELVYIVWVERNKAKLGGRPKDRPLRSTGDDDLSA